MSIQNEKFLVINPHGVRGYFGKGSTLDEAKTNLKRCGGKLDRYIAYRMPDGASNVGIDMVGHIQWTWTEGADRKGEPEVVAKRGVTTDG